MNNTIFIAAAVSLAFTNAFAEDGAALKSEQDKLSYAIGVETARTISKGDVPLNQELIIQGLRDAFANRSLLAPEPELRRIMNAFRGQIYAKTAQSRRAVTEGNKHRESVFLGENRQRDGVQTLADGIQYRVVSEGNGKSPAPTDTVELRYRGTLLDGNEFANTTLGQPLRQKLNVVGPVGLKAVIGHMSPGAKWQVWVPSSLGYGERGVGDDIGPNELLVYDVELLAVAQ